MTAPGLGAHGQRPPNEIAVIIQGARDLLRLAKTGNYPRVLPNLYVVTSRKLFRTFYSLAIVVTSN